MQYRFIIRTQIPSQVGVNRIPGDHSMGEDDPFGKTGGAGGVNDELRVIRAYLDFRGWFSGQRRPNFW